MTTPFQCLTVICFVLWTFILQGLRSFDLQRTVVRFRRRLVHGGAPVQSVLPEQVKRATDASACLRGATMSVLIRCSYHLVFSPLQPLMIQTVVVPSVVVVDDCRLHNVPDDRLRPLRA